MLLMDGKQFGMALCLLCKIYVVYLQSHKIRRSVFANLSVFYDSHYLIVQVCKPSAPDDIGHFPVMNNNFWNCLGQDSPPAKNRLPFLLLINILNNQSNKFHCFSVSLSGTCYSLVYPDPFTCTGHYRFQFKHLAIYIANGHCLSNVIVNSC